MSRFVLDFAEGAAHKIAELTDRRPLIGAAVLEALAELAVMEVVEPQEMTAKEAQELALSISNIPLLPPKMPTSLAKVMTVEDEAALSASALNQETVQEPIVEEAANAPLNVEQEQALNNDGYNGTAQSTTENDIDIAALDDLDLGSLELPDFGDLDVDEIDIEGIDMTQFDDINLDEND